jgi:hypothetical protein
MTILKQKLKFNSRIHRFAIVAVFVFAQLFSAFHHVSDPHDATDDETFVECGICLVANMPFHSGDDLGQIHSPHPISDHSGIAHYEFEHEQSVSLGHARAPPQA